MFLWVCHCVHSQITEANVGRDPEYLRHAINHTTSVGLAALVLKIIPKYLRPYKLPMRELISRFIALFFVNIRRGEQALEKFVGPIFQERLQKMRELGCEYQRQVGKSYSNLSLG